MSGTDEKHTTVPFADSGPMDFGPMYFEPTSSKPVAHVGETLADIILRAKREEHEKHEGPTYNHEMTLYDVHKPLPYTFKTLSSGFSSEPTHSKKMFSPIKYVAKPTIQSIPESTEKKKKKKKKKVQEQEQEQDTIIDETVKDVLEHIKNKK